MTTSLGPRLRRFQPELPTDADVAAKRAVYAAAEPRDIAYRVARYLVERAYRGETDFTVGEGVAILLMSWNSGFYRFRPSRARTLLEDLDRLVGRHGELLTQFRARSAAS